ncbi:MAG TPA: MATE family efflux transporter [Bryobacteraceae bacterium]|nr:MATE family efflux transporter [Bryobacteraceae bacterium]
MAAAAVTEQRLTIWQSIREAIRGSQRDFTEGSISRAIVLLAIPMVLEMVMESLFAITNVFWVTRLGANAIATVGLTESMLTLVFAVAIGVSMSTTAMVARRIGEKDPRAAATAAVQAIVLGVVLAVLMGVPGYWLAPRLLELMGAPADLVATGKQYTALVLGGSITVLLLFLNNAIFRGAGDASIAMRVLWFSNLINMALDPCFIFGLGPFPELGVTGAGVSTVIGRGSGVLYQLWILGSGKSRVLIRREDLRIVPAVITSLMRVSVTGILQFAIAHTSWIALVRFISGFGASAVAGYTIGIRIFIFAILPSWGLSGAAATMAGQNLGARKPQRAERAVYLTGFYNMIVLAVIAIAFIGMPEAIVRLFTDDPAVVPHAVDCLRILGYGNVVYAWGMVLVQGFNGAGDTVTPTMINVVGFWLCEIPLAWGLAHPMGMGVRGVFISIPTAELVMTVLAAAMFMRGRWKTRQI